MVKIEKDAGAMAVGVEAFKAAFLLNGAGAIALLSFWGLKHVGETPTATEAIADALILMAGGAALTPIGLGLSYIAIHSQYRDPARARWRVWQWLSMSCVGVSALVFSIAVWALATDLPSALQATSPPSVGSIADKEVE